MIIKIIIVVICVVIVNRLDYYISKKYKSNKWYLIYLERFFILLEVIGVNAFIILLTLWLFNDTVVRIVTIVGTITNLIILYWFILKDYFAGLIVKFRKELKIKDLIRIDESVGRIAKLDFLSIELENTNKDIEVISYSRFLHAEVIYLNTEPEIIKSYIYVRHKKTQLISIVSESIIASILNSHFHVPTQIPIIKAVEQNDELFEFKITVFTLDLNNSRQLEEYLNIKFK